MPQSVQAAKPGGWSHDYITALPDSAFLHVDGGKRQFPVKDEDGVASVSQLLAALVSLHLSPLPQKADLRRKALGMLSAARKGGSELAKGDVPVVPTVKHCGDPAAHIGACPTDVGKGAETTNREQATMNEAGTSGIAKGDMGGGGGAGGQPTTGDLSVGDLGKFGGLKGPEQPGARRSHSALDEVPLATQPGLVTATKRLKHLAKSKGKRIAKASPLDEVPGLEPKAMLAKAAPAPSAAGVLRLKALAKAGTAEYTRKAATEEHTIVLTTDVDGLLCVTKVLKLLQRLGQIGASRELFVEADVPGGVSSICGFDGDGSSKLVAVTIDGVAVTASPDDYVEKRGPKKGAKFRRRGVKKALFRKQPIEVQAVQLVAPQDVVTMDGTMHGDTDDWLIEGVAGEKYICDAAIFQQTYEPADDAAQALWEQAYGQNPVGGPSVLAPSAPVPMAPPEMPLAGGAPISRAWRIAKALSAAIEYGGPRRTLDAEPALLTHPSLTLPLTETYTPKDTGGWQGAISPADESWIGFVDEDGAGLLWTEREPGYGTELRGGGILGTPVAFERPDLAMVPEDPSRLNGQGTSPLDEASRTLTSAACAASSAAAQVHAETAIPDARWFAAQQAAVDAHRAAQASYANQAEALHTSGQPDQAARHAGAAAYHQQQADAHEATAVAPPLPSIALLEPATKAGSGARVHLAVETIPTPMKKDAAATAVTNAGPQNQEGDGFKRVSYQGIPVVLDRPKGFVMTGKNDETGEDWSRTYTCDYGFIPGTQGGDGDGLDVFYGDTPDANDAYWIRQIKADGSFDEFKILFGFKDAATAKAVYLAHVPAKFLDSMSIVPVDMVKAILGIDPANGIAKAFISSMKAESVSPIGVASVKAWIARRAIDQTEPVGAALVKSLNKIAKALEPSDGISSMIARAYTSFLCDAWDGAGVLAHEPVDYANATKVIAANAQAMAHILTTVFNVATVNAPKRTMTPEDWMQLFVESVPAPVPAAPKRPEPEQALGLGNRVPEADHAPDGRLRALDAPIDLSPTSKSITIQGHDLDVGKAAQIAKFVHGCTGRPSALFVDGMRLDFTPIDAQPTIAPPAAPSQVQRMPAKLTPHIIEVRKDNSPGELRYVLGIVLEPDTVDAQGDTYDAESIRKTAWLYMEHFRNIGLQHKALVNGMVVLVESFIAPCSMNLNGTVIRQGTWLMGLHIVDDGLWEQVQAGQLTGLSIAGFAERIPLSMAA